ncbi:MAG: hypothetical protein NE328_08660 [Lentisphaeraceae bacterium]|nr:hypothetical protein [Lentisphaeraceae bacterium]
MSTLRDNFDVRPISKGIKTRGSKHVVSNQIGKHIYHVGEHVELHCHDSIIHVKIIGSVNDHMIGEIIGFNENEKSFENMKAGQKITFDEENIFDCHED